MQRATTLAVTASLLTLLLATVPAGQGAMMPCDATTLPALIAKGAGKTVLVPPGTYCGDVTLPPNTRLVSTDGAARTIIQGGTYGLTLEHGEFYHVIGFTFTGATLHGLHQDDAHHGGAIAITDNAFHGNGGWGVHLLTMHDAFVERNTFRDNGVGGVRMAGEMMMGMSFQVNRNVFQNERVAIAYDEGMNGRIIGNVLADSEVGVHVMAWETLRFYDNHFVRLGTAVDLAAGCGIGMPMNVAYMALEGNRFTDNAAGIVARGGPDCAGEPYGVHGLQIHRNSFLGTTGYAIDGSTNLAMGPVQAKGNYWGSDLGPSVGQRAPGLGDLISVGVFDPTWCTRMGCPPDLDTLL